MPLMKAFCTFWFPPPGQGTALGRAAGFRAACPQVHSSKHGYYKHGVAAVCPEGKGWLSKMGKAGRSRRLRALGTDRQPLLFPSFCQVGARLAMVHRQEGQSAILLLPQIGLFLHRWKPVLKTKSKANLKLLRGQDFSHNNNNLLHTEEPNSLLPRGFCIGPPSSAAVTSFQGLNSKLNKNNRKHRIWYL